MEQPEGCVAPGKDWVWRLEKGLDGLVQAGRTWSEELNGHMGSEGFTTTAKGPAVHVKNSWKGQDLTAAGFWVDDCNTLGSGKELASLAKSVDVKYGITGLDEVRWVLEMLMERDRPARTISISQEAFIDSILARFNLVDASTVSTSLAPEQLSAADCLNEKDKKDEKEEMGTRSYRELVGALAWLALGTRPGIAFATSSLARCGHSLGHCHWEAAKRVLRYLKGTKTWRLKLGGKTRRSPPS